MEPPQHQHHHQADQESGNTNNKSGSSGYTCRQTSTRWTPTTEQIRILKDLYYNSGVRSPTVDQIQKITSRLRQYGKIEGKNVFYWFQNNKARERQKKRSNGSDMTTLSPYSFMMANDHYHQHQHHHHHGVTMQRPSNSVNVKLNQDPHLYHQNKSYPNFNNGNSNHATSGSEYGVMNASNGNNHVYEQDCSMSHMDHNHHYSSAPYNFFEKPKPLFGQEDDQEYGDDVYLEHRRTLPLFPMHGDGGAIWKYDQSDGRDRYGRGPCASLELCLNSYAGVAPE